MEFNTPPSMLPTTYKGAPTGGAMSKDVRRPDPVPVPVDPGDPTRARERWEPPPIARPAWREEMIFSLGVAGLLLILGIGLLVELVPVPAKPVVSAPAADLQVIWGIPPEAQMVCSLGHRDDVDDCPKTNVLVRVPLHNSLPHPIPIQTAQTVASQPLVFELIQDDCSNTTLDANATCMINYVIHGENIVLPGTYTFSMVVPGLVGHAGTVMQVVP